MPTFKVLISPGSGGSSSPYKGAWAADTDYLVGDEVSHGGDFYRSGTDHTSSADNAPGTVGGAGIWTKIADAITAPQQTWLDDHVGGINPAVVSDDLRLCDRYDTIVTAKAATAVNGRLCFVKSVATYYECVVSGNAYTPDDTTVLQIGAGNARWVAKAGQYEYAVSAHNLIQNAMLPLAGEVFVPFAYTNTADATSHQLNSAAKKITVGFVAKADFSFNSASWYKPAVGAAGDLAISLHADGLAYEPSGSQNGSLTNVAPITMTNNTTPAPFVVTAKNADGTDAHGVASAFGCFDGSTAETAGCTIIACKKLLIAGAVVDKGGGKVGIGCTGHGIATGAPVQFDGLTNYVAVYAVDATSTANEIVVTAAYVAEAIDATDFVFFQPNAANPLYLVLDRGAGGGQRVNKYRITSRNNAGATLRGFPSAWTKYKVDDLTGLSVYDSTGWTSLGSETGQTDPGQANFRGYYATNATAYRYTMFKFTGVVAAATATPYLCILAIEEYGAQLRSAPGTRLDDPAAFGNFDGTGAAAWGRLSFGTAYQGQRGKKYWITVNGAAGVDVSLALGRVNGTNGTEFPDHSECLFSTDTGTTWSQAVISGKDAMLCMVLNSTVNHSPPLMVGRKRGMTEYLPSVGHRTIPAAGLTVAGVEDLAGNTIAALLAEPTSAVRYNLYYHDNAGSLAVEASTTGRVIGAEGIEVKSGTTSYRWIGQFAPVERQTGKQAPIKVADVSLVWNKGDRLPIGKSNPYVSSTASNPRPPLLWTRWTDDTIWTILFLCAEPSYLKLNAGGGSCVGAVNEVAAISIGLDGAFPHWKAQNGTVKFVGTANVPMEPAVLEVPISEGVHSAVPLIISRNSTGTATTFYYLFELSYAQTPRYGSLAQFLGEIWCQ